MRQPGPDGRVRRVPQPSRSSNNSSRVVTVSITSKNSEGDPGLAASLVRVCTASILGVEDRPALAGRLPSGLIMRLFSSHTCPAKGVALPRGVRSAHGCGCADARGRPRRALAAPRGAGPTAGRVRIQASTSASVQARLFGPIMRPGGKPSRAMRTFRVGQFGMMPRSRRSPKRSNLVIGLTPVCICTNWLSTYTIFSVPVEGNPTIHRGCARNSGNYPTIHRGRTQTSAASAGVYRRFVRFTMGVTLSRG